MKKTIRIMGVAVLSLLAASVHAQQTWEAKKNPTVDSILSKYEGKMVASRTELTTTDIFPVIGKYESATNTDAASVTISLDEQNKGLVWINGLPQGKVKAMLRKSPATYKIPAQKTEDGKDVAEGTLIFDKETNTLSISIGKMYNAEDPASAFVTPAIGDEVVPPANVNTKVKGNKIKTKKPEPPKAWVYTGTKVSTETVAK